jgi:hypothetical protein
VLTVVCVASSGFEESARRCPTICGSCSTGVYPGCNGVAGSGRTVDSCGVCGGQNTLCQQPCGIQALQQCTRTVSISAGLAQSSDQKCRLHVRALGGRALLGQIMVTEDDCGTSLPAYQVNGFAELRTCVAAQPQCTSVDAATFAENTCTRRRQVFDSAAWQHYCPSFNASRTSFECNMSLPNFDSYSSSLPDDVGVYSLTVSRALANGMFGQGVFMTLSHHRRLLGNGCRMPVVGNQWDRRISACSTSLSSTQLWRLVLYYLFCHGS